MAETRERLAGLDEGLQDELLERIRKRLVETADEFSLKPRPPDAVPWAPLAQERLWFLDQLAPGRPTYNIPWRLWLRGVVDVGALERALGFVVGRHEVLRARFFAREGRPWQLVEPELLLPLRLVEVGGREEALALSRAEAGQPFALERGPLLRASLWRLPGGREQLLGLSVHHIVSDGWSFRGLGEELAAAYNAYRARPEPRLAPLPLQYGDYAAWQRRWLSGERLQRLLAFWRRQLHGLAPLELPGDRPRPAQ